MRSLLPLVLVPSLFGCAHIEHDRWKVREGPTGIQCQPGRTIASVDSTPRDTVKLTFERTENCVRDYEQVWATRTETQLAKPVRVILTVLAASTVAVPLIALAVAITPKGGGSNKGFDEAMAHMILWPTATVGAVAWAGNGVQIGSSEVETVERSQRTEAASLGRIIKGTFIAPGLMPRPVVSGSVDLSLDEALALEPGQLSLDGAKVQLSEIAVARIASLAVCKQALDGFDPDALPWVSKPSVEARRRFVDPVIETIGIFQQESYR